MGHNANHTRSHVKPPDRESLSHQTAEVACNSGDLAGDSAGDKAVTQGDSGYEAEIHRRIVNALIAAGYWPETLVQGAGRPPRRQRLVWFGKTRGAPDIDVMGENVHLEVKRPKESPEPHQRAYHARARRFGAVVATVRSPEDALAVMDGVQALRALLRAIDRLLWL